jgi:GntR family transcriptional repressor for pyruvate dehydrogenase complex
MAQKDAEYHQLVSRASGNRVFADLQGLYKGVFPESQKLAMARHAQLWEPAMEHERILQAIERRDPDGAAYYMRTHITRAAGRAGVAILDIV